MLHYFTGICLKVIDVSVNWLQPNFPRLLFFYEGEEKTATLVHFYDIPVFHRLQIHTGILSHYFIAARIAASRTFS